MASNKNLSKAKEAKKDEFYTQLTDIEKEMRHYSEHFRGKTVLCNCDDPKVSNFFVYFVRNFAELGLKRLITTCYKNNQPDLFSQHDCEQAVWLDYRGGDDNNPDLSRIAAKAMPLKGDGDFRSAECIELLKEADIVVTNPPFSLFREYVAQLVKYEKKYLIIGNVNAITYKEIFPLIKNNEAWLGATIHSGDREFGVPDDYPLASAGHRTDENGKKYIRVKGVRWFTNLEYKERHDPIDLYKKYTPDEYPRYENYDAINVDKTSDIPIDYKGKMGVPITFLDKYCPEQFEIIGQTQGDSGKELGLKPFDRELKKLNPSLRDGQLYYMEGGIPVKPYARILIKPINHGY